MSEDNDTEPITIITDKDGYCVAAGKPDCFTKKELGAYASEGFNIERTTFANYKSKNLKWVWDKKN